MYKGGCFLLQRPVAVRFLVLLQRLVAVAFFLVSISLQFFDLNTPLQIDGWYNLQFVSKVAKLINRMTLGEDIGNLFKGR
jgi:hypothetical protein